MQGTRSYGPRRAQSTFVNGVNCGASSLRPDSRQPHRSITNPIPQDGHASAPVRCSVSSKSAATPCGLDRLSHESSGGAARLVRGSTARRPRIRAAPSRTDCDGECTPGCNVPTDRPLVQPERRKFFHGLFRRVGRKVEYGDPPHPVAVNRLSPSVEEWLNFGPRRKREAISPAT